MKEIIGDIWTYHDLNYPIVITTNGTIKSNGACVMGRGVAKQAAERYPHLPISLANRIQQFGNLCFYFPLYKIFTLPVKYEWWQPASIKLILDSCHSLVNLVTAAELPQVYLVRPGCGAGGLSWKRDVKPAIAPVLDHRFIVVQK